MLELYILYLDMKSDHCTVYPSKVCILDKLFNQTTYTNFPSGATLPYQVWPSDYQSADR